jgi:hypothetical protein
MDRRDGLAEAPSFAPVTTLESLLSPRRIRRNPVRQAM